MYLLSYISDIMHISIEEEMTQLVMGVDIASSKTIEHNIDEID